MADKSFGVKELNLLNASGTPTITSPNTLNLNATTVAISTNTTVGNNITVTGNITANGNIVGDNSTNISGISSVTATTYYGSGANLTGISAGISTASSNIQATWDVVNNGASAYRFTGPGQDGAEDNPDVYLVRGQRYRFSVNASGHPFQLRVSNGGSAYTDGVTNNGATSGNVEINVQHDAPAQLYYQCTNHGGMVGNIYIVGGPQVISGVVTATTFSGSGANLTALNASNLGSGTVPTARLGSGTANSSTFLRGDSTFATLPSQVSISNNGNDRIITGGSGVNLNGEANLQFDGTDLYVSDKIKHLGDPNTFIEFATDTVTVDTGGSERLRIDSSGNLIMPAGAFDLRVGDNTNSNAGTQTISVGSISSGSSGGIGIFANPTNGNSFIQFGDGTAAADQYRGYMNYQHASDKLIFGTAGSDRVTITSAGFTKIGFINNANPTEPLHVVASAINQDIARFTGANSDRGLLISTAVSGSINDALIKYDADSQNSAGQHAFLTDGQERMRISSSGEIKAIDAGFDSRWGNVVDVSVSTSSWAQNTFYRVVNDNVFDSSNDTYLVWFKWSHDGSGAPWIITGNFLWTPTGANVTGAASAAFTPVQSAHNSTTTISFQGVAGGNVRQGLQARADTWNPSGGDLVIKASKIGHPFA